LGSAELLGDRNGRRTSGFLGTAAYTLAYTVAYAVAWVGIVVAAGALAVRFVPVTNHAVLTLASLSPFLTTAAAVSTVILVFLRKRRTAVVAASLFAAAAAVQLPWFIGPEPTAANSVAVRVLTVNVSEGSADAAVLAAVMREHADIVLFQEITPEQVSRLTQTGVGTDFAHQVNDARPGANGVAIWSRWPVGSPSRIPEYELGVLTADVDIPGVPTATTVVTAHISGPWPQPITEWRREMDALPETIADLIDRAGSRPVIMGGDFNATLDMAPFRRALRPGVRDAAEQAGAGLIHTFPANAEFPALIGIDHVLTYNGSATSARTVPIPGSDHLGLLAAVALTGS
jgi:endonuclease/exonuclease/phosphatase (EEP) superfamily protein YafD